MIIKTIEILQWVRVSRASSATQISRILHQISRQKLASISVWYVPPNKAMEYWGSSKSGQLHHPKLTLRCKGLPLYDKIRRKGWPKYNNSYNSRRIKGSILPWIYYTWTISDSNRGKDREDILWWWMVKSSSRLEFYKEMRKRCLFNASKRRC